MNRWLVLIIVALSVTGCGASQISDPHARGNQPGVTRIHCRIVDGKADHRCTPGALNPNVTVDNLEDTICKPGWTATIRPPTEYTSQLKAQQMQNYDETGSSSDYAEDHLIALSIGGDSRNPNNLFPQPRRDALMKDNEERRLHTDLCAGRISLAEAQRTMLLHWTH